MTDPAVRRATAHHESAHAALAWLHRRPLRIVSIRPGFGYSGITLCESRYELSEPFEASVPILLQPEQTRAAIEADIVATLAGPIAGRWAAQTSGFYEADPCETYAAKAAAALAALSPRHRELVTVEEASEAERIDDETAAQEMSWALVGHHDESAAHLAWLDVVARNLVTAHWHRIAALADVLLERTVVDGVTAAAIIAAAPRGETHA